MSNLSLRGQDRDLSLPSGIVFRLKSDLDLVAYQRTLHPLCTFLRKLAVDEGLASCEIESHLVSPKYHPAEEI